MLDIYRDRIGLSIRDINEKDEKNRLVLIVSRSFFSFFFSCLSVSFSMGLDPTLFSISADLLKPLTRSRRRRL